MSRIIRIDDKIYDDLIQLRSGDYKETMSDILRKLIKKARAK